MLETSILVLPRLFNGINNRRNTSFATCMKLQWKLSLKYVALFHLKSGRGVIQNINYCKKEKHMSKFPKIVPRFGPREHLKYSREVGAREHSEFVRVVGAREFPVSRKVGARVHSEVVRDVGARKFLVMRKVLSASALRSCASDWCERSPQFVEG